MGEAPAQTSLAKSMELAVKHLVGLGHQKIGYLSSTTHSYVYQADMIEKYLAVWNTGMLTCRISGLEQLPDFAITADVYACGAVVNAETVA